MLRTLKIVIGISLGLAVLALLASPKKPGGQDPSTVGEASPSTEFDASLVAGIPSSTPSENASSIASPGAVSDSGPDLTSDPARNPSVDLRGGIFGSVLSVVAEWKEGELRSTAEKTGETPRALRQFSAEMAERMTEVWKNASSHEAAFAQLALCARTASLASPVRALCAANAKRISLNDSGRFRSRFLELDQQLPGEIREFLSAVKQAR